MTVLPNFLAMLCPLAFVSPFGSCMESNGQESQAWPLSDSNKKNFWILGAVFSRDQTDKVFYVQAPQIKTEPIAVDALQQSPLPTTSGGYRPVGVGPTMQSVWSFHWSRQQQFNNTRYKIITWDPPIFNCPMC